METQSNSKSTTDLPSTTNQLSNSSNKENKRKSSKNQCKRITSIDSITPLPQNPLVKCLYEAVEVIGGCQEIIEIL